MGATAITTPKLTKALSLSIHFYLNKSLPGDSDFFSVEVTGGILLLELLCMERLLAVTEGELEESTGRLDIETGLLEFPGASVG